MTEVITTSIDLGKPIRCPHHKPGETCRATDCRFRGECMQADGEFGEENEIKS